MKSHLAPQGEHPWLGNPALRGCIEFYYPHTLELEQVHGCYFEQVPVAGEVVDCC